jgi:hypothetical protein
VFSSLFAVSSASPSPPPASKSTALQPGILFKSPFFGTIVQHNSSQHFAGCLQSLGRTSLPTPSHFLMTCLSGSLAGSMLGEVHTSAASSQLQPRRGIFSIALRPSQRSWADILFLGPIAGIMMSDFWILRHRHLNLASLYRHPDIYSFFTVSISVHLLLSPVALHQIWLALQRQRVTSMSRRELRTFTA